MNETPEESYSIVETSTRGLSQTWTHRASQRMGDLAESALRRFLEWCPTAPKASAAWGCKRADQDAAYDSSWSYWRNCSRDFCTTEKEGRGLLKESNGLLCCHPDVHHPLRTRGGGEGPLLADVSSHHLAEDSCAQQSSCHELLSEARIEWQDKTVENKLTNSWGKETLGYGGNLQQENQQGLVPCNLNKNRKCDALL